MNKLMQEAAKLIESKESYLKLYKPYHSPKEYLSLKMVLTILAVEVEIFNKFGIDTEDIAKSATLAFAFKCMTEDYQVYWLKPDLMDALMNTELPSKLENFTTPVKNAIFMLPKPIISPDKDLMRWIGVNYLIANEDYLTVVTPDRKIVDGELVAIDKLNCITQLQESAIIYSSRVEIHADGNIGTGGFVDKSFFKNTNEKEEFEFRTMLHELSLKILLYMNIHTEEVIQKPSRYVPKGFGKTSNKLNPIYLGEQYRIQYIKRSHTSDDNKRKSPKQHWRRGHFRQQAIKDGHKLIWIKPTLVS